MKTTMSPSVTSVTVVIAKVTARATSA